MRNNRNFIKAAIRILEREGKPLDIKLILEKAINNGELETKGKTPKDTMRSKISEHIRKYSDNSLIVRVGPNKFGLREWDLNVYDENPFVKKSKGEYVVCIPQSVINESGRFFGYSSNVKQIVSSITSHPPKFLEKSNVENDDRYKQLIAYVMLFNEKREILSFQRGKYSTANKQLLEGAICIGFGGHVTIKDYYQLFSFQDQDAGIRQAAVREIREELRDHWDDPLELELLGVINDDSSPTGLCHLGIVLRGYLPSKFDIDNVNTERSINKLKFRTPSNLWEQFNELEFWSQLLCKEYWAKPPNLTPVTIKNNRIRKIEGPISIVGEISTGKTVISKFLSKRYQLPIVYTRSCVADLIGVEDFLDGRRDIFSQKASNLVSDEEGILRLAKRIIDEINKQKRNIVIIDGIRNLKTNEIIKNTFPKLTTVYIDCPRDKSYQLYRLRTKHNATIDEFRILRYHEVEKEVTKFEYFAEVKIYNGGTEEELFSTIGPWFDKRI